MRRTWARVAALAWAGLGAGALSAADLRLAQLSAEFVVNPSGHMLVPATRPGDGATDEPCAAAAPAEPCPPQPPAEAPLVEPYPVEMIAPDYPSELAALATTQEAVVCFTVTEAGTVISPMVVSATHDALAAPVLAAISASRFAPARSDGRAVRSTACRTYHFVVR